MSAQSLTPHCDAHGHLWECYTVKGQPFYGQCLRCRRWPTPQDIEAIAARPAQRDSAAEPVSAQDSLFDERKHVTF